VEDAFRHRSDLVCLHHLGERRTAARGGCCTSSASDRTTTADDADARGSRSTADHADRRGRRGRRRASRRCWQIDRQPQAPVTVHVLVVADRSTSTDAGRMFAPAGAATRCPRISLRVIERRPRMTPMPADPEVPRITRTDADDGVAVALRAGAGRSIGSHKHPSQFMCLWLPTDLPARTPAACLHRPARRPAAADLAPRAQRNQRRPR
jgi:hypothetical protein